MRLRSPAAPSAALAVGAALLTAGVWLTPSAAGAATANSCANPILATDVAGWGTLNGETSTRTAVTDHPTARWEFSVANRAAVTAGIYLPQVSVQPGQVWSFSVDTRTRNDPARSRMEVDWYDSADHFLGHDDGEYRPVSGQRTFTPVAGTFTVPSAAVQAHVLVRATDLAPKCLAQPLHGSLRVARTECCFAR